MDVEIHRKVRMSLFERIKQEQKEAMKSKDVERLSVLRMLSSALSYAQIDAKEELSEEQTMDILRREAKKRREAIEAYKKAGREELAAKEAKELEVIESYLPSMMSEDEVRAKLAKMVESKEYDNFGEAMRDAMSELKGKADGSVVAKVLRELMA